MRFLTSLLPLTTLALRVAATDLSPGSRPIPLTNINHQYPAPMKKQPTPRQRSPCRNCLEKAKDIIAAKIKASVNGLKVVVGSSLGVITEHPVASLFIFVGCFAVGSSALAIYCTVEYEKFEWCPDYLRHHRFRRDPGQSTCQRLECGDDVCGVPQTLLTSGGHPTRDLARTLYRRRLEGLDDEDKNE
ncbi:hypothetical protein C8J55DRAFT_498937 [Lentinula edodes]|uniref:Uncharacterized protein n=1 Tax=Lentinula lateritia TaxID=40482 RepID=A0A9W9AYE4_9AGAR|nr:hypothetical protein C8J55DRAFT_498937 [Lentinula edodes]